jgi:hypothetical protein
MGKLYAEIDARLRAFIESQAMFFVATAPAGSGGHLNLSPKGLDSLRILGPRQIAYLDYVGSGAETIAHLRENGRVALMLCAFAGPPKIVRLQGRGEVIEPQDRAFAELLPHFPVSPGVRAIIRINLDRVSDSCGYGVPLYRHEGSRSQLGDWAEQKGTDGLRRYQRDNNASSIDGLPALRWVADRSESAAPSERPKRASDRGSRAAQDGESPTASSAPVRE